MTQQDTQPPTIEIHFASSEISAAAGETNTRLSPEQIAAIQQTVSALASDFHPPVSKIEDDHFRMESLEMGLGFTIEAGTGPALKLILDASTKASIDVKVTWSRKK